MKIDNQKIEETLIAIRNQLMGNWEMNNKSLYFCRDVLIKLQNGLLIELPEDKIVIIEDKYNGEQFMARQFAFIYNIVLKEWDYRYANKENSIWYNMNYCYKKLECGSWEQAEQRLEETTNGHKEMAQ